MPEGDDPIAVAVAFVARQEDGPGKILRVHARDTDAYCAACRVRPVRWPCAAAAIALRALAVANAGAHVPEISAGASRTALVRATGMQMRHRRKRRGNDRGIQLRLPGSLSRGTARHARPRNAPLDSAPSGPDTHDDKGPPSPAPQEPPDDEGTDDREATP
jgi:hypothetical protein